MDTPNADTSMPRAPIITVNRSRTSFRVWDGRHQMMRYPWSDKHFFPYRAGFSGQAESFAMRMSGTLTGIAYDQQLCTLTHQLDVQIVPLLDTGLVAEGNPDRHVYEGDIISFTVRGAAHGREEDKCLAAHVWWNTKDACWAFGRWPFTHNGEYRGDWWYTAQDDGFDHSSLKILGNLFENPELIPSLGYDNPSL